MKKDELGVYQDGKMRRKCVRFQIARSTIELVWMVIAQVHSFVIVTLDGKLQSIKYHCVKSEASLIHLRLSLKSLIIVGLVNIVKNVFDYQDVLMDIVKQVSSANAMKGMRVWHAKKVFFHIIICKIKSLI